MLDMMRLPCMLRQPPDVIGQLIDLEDFDEYAIGRVQVKMGKFLGWRDKAIMDRSIVQFVPTSAAPQKKMPPEDPNRRMPAAQQGKRTSTTPRLQLNLE
jgi:hypothetical protein